MVEKRNIIINSARVQNMLPIDFLDLMTASVVEYYDNTQSLRR